MRTVLVGAPGPSPEVGPHDRTAAGIALAPDRMICQGLDMVSRTAHFCLDAHDPRAQVEWWAQVLDDFVPEDDEDDEDDEDETGLRGPAGRSLLFLRVPEAKTVKNRMHVCLRPVDRTRDEEVERLLGIGATMVHDLRDGERGWAVLADPEGNEFCVLTTPADEAGVER